MGQTVSAEARPMVLAVSALAVLVGGVPMLVVTYAPSDVRIDVALVVVGLAALVLAAVEVGRTRRSAAARGVPWVSLALVITSIPLFVAPSTLTFRYQGLALPTYIAGAIGIFLRLYRGRLTKADVRAAEASAGRSVRLRVLGLCASAVVLAVGALPIIDIAFDTGEASNIEGEVTAVSRPKHAYDPNFVDVGDFRFLRADPMPRVAVGDRIRVAVRPGRLGLRWVSDVRRLGGATD